MQIILQQKGVCYENTNNRMGCQFELTMLLYRVFLCLSATFLKFHTKLSDNKKDNRDDCLFLFLIHFNTLLFEIPGVNRQ